VGVDIVPDQSEINGTAGRKDSREEKEGREKPEFWFHGRPGALEVKCSAGMIVLALVL